MGLNDFRTRTGVHWTLAPEFVVKCLHVPWEFGIQRNLFVTSSACPVQGRCAVCLQDLGDMPLYRAACPCAGLHLLATL